MNTPLVPRITKSTAVAAIRARFENDGQLLERFEVAKEQANLWDGERDGLREAVKQINPGQFTAPSGNTVILSRTETAKVLYPNAAGKHQLENCLQCDIKAHAEAGVSIIAFGEIAEDPAHFLEIILSELQKGRDHAIEFLEQRFIGSGKTVDNAELYEKKGSEKTTITVIS
jgi:hypothetical protein